MSLLTSLKSSQKDEFPQPGDTSPELSSSTTPRRTNEA